MDCVRPELLQDSCILQREKKKKKKQKPRMVFPFAGRGGAAWDTLYFPHQNGSRACTNRAAPYITCAERRTHCIAPDFLNFSLIQNWNKTKNRENREHRR